MPQGQNAIQNINPRERKKERAAQKPLSFLLQNVSAAMYSDSSFFIFFQKSVKGLRGSPLRRGAATLKKLSQFFALSVGLLCRRSVRALSERVLRDSTLIDKSRKSALTYRVKIDIA